MTTYFRKLSQAAVVALVVTAVCSFMILETADASTLNASQASPEFQIVITDKESGEVLLDATGKDAETKAGEQGTVEYKIRKADIAEYSSGGVAALTLDISFGGASSGARDSNIGTVERPDLTAILRINYSVQSVSGQRQVRIDSLTGSWTPVNSQISVQSREVHAHQGPVLFGQNMSRYPSNNAFSYTTGWTNYVDSYGTDLSYAEGTTYCNIFVSGMGTTYDVNVRVGVQ